MKHLIVILCAFVMAGCASGPTVTAPAIASRGQIETSIRLAVYLHYFERASEPFRSEILFVDEPDSVIQTLKERTGIGRFQSMRFCQYDKGLHRPVDIRTHRPGIQFQIDRYKVSENRASLIFSWFASPIGAQNYEVELRTDGDTWVIDKWEDGLTS